MKEVIASLADAFYAASKELYLVGGCVRDTLLGKEPHDIDCATNALPDEIKQIVATTNPLHIVPVGEKFGTIQVHYASGIIEITTYRGERYVPGSRKPDVQFGTDLIEDLRRRDFTINALAQAPTGILVDPFGGQADLGNSTLRAVDNPVQRFIDDPLRLLRAARFVAQLRLNIAGDTFFAMKLCADQIREISQERIRDELCKMLMLLDANSGLQVLLETGVLSACLPEVAALVGVDQHPHHRLDVFGHTRLVLWHCPERIEVRIAALFHDIAKPLTRTVDEQGTTHFYEHEDVGAEMTRDILRRLRFGNDVVERVSKIVKLHMRVNAYVEGWSNVSVRRLFVAAGDVLDDLLDLAVADGISDRSEPIKSVVARIDHLRKRIKDVQAEVTKHPLVSPLNGDELMEAFGLGPGPWLKAMKQHLTTLVVEGTLQPDDKEDAIEAARDFYNRSHGFGVQITVENEATLKRLEAAYGLHELKKMEKE